MKKHKTNSQSLIGSFSQGVWEIWEDVITPIIILAVIALAILGIKSLFS